jgi:uncharacterized membrane protein YqjE
MGHSTESTIRQGKESGSIDFLVPLRIVRTAGTALCKQAGLYGQLARVEWQEEKNRLIRMLLLALLGFASLLCFMLIAGIAVMAFSWDSGYRLPAIIGLLLLYGAGLGTAWHFLGVLSAARSQSFSALREELSTDAALFRSQLYDG